jgi:transcriptional regulator GlxA family with amidase domain
MLAEAGLLDGRRATTHWYYARNMQRDYPKIAVEADRMFTTDGPIWTSAGMSAGVDLALALVENDLGAEIAREVAKILVVYHRRAGGQSQYSTLLDLDATSDRVQTALAYAKEHLSTPLSVGTLANAAFLSPRQFSRLFREEKGAVTREGNRAAARGVRTTDDGGRALLRGGNCQEERVWKS